MHRRKAFCSMTQKGFREAIANSHDGIMIADNKGKITYLNEAYIRLSGFPNEKILGRNVKEIIEEGILNRSAVLMAIEQKELVTITQHYPDRSSTIVAANPIFDANGNVDKVIINVRDTTELMLLKHEIERAEEAMRDFCERFTHIKHEYGDKIIAVSRKMKNIFALAQKISNVDVSVLILGETGVGKEVIAQFIHDRSNRKNNSFIAINCGAIPEQLLESELFGYVEGSFTGAVKGGKKGLFEAADGGTLFLDELGDISPATQVKILRALETRTITRIGGRTPIPVDVRILAATHRNLTQMVKTGEFRDDLYYRLNVVKIEIPPLRERTEDIIPLSLFYLDYFNKRYNLNKKMTPMVLNELKKHTWPGNIRELKNVVERLVVISNDDELQAGDVAFGDEPEVGNTTEIDDKSIDEEKVVVSEIMPLSEVVEMAEKQVLEMAKAEYGSTRAMAKVLGVDHSTVIRKLRKYNLNV